MDPNLPYPFRQNFCMESVTDGITTLGINAESPVLSEIFTSRDDFFILALHSPIVEANIANNSIGEVVRPKIVVTKEGIRFNLHISHLAKLFKKGPKWMKGSNRPTFDASHKNAVRVGLMVFNKVTWGLLSWDGDQRDSLISWLEPNNLGFILRSFWLRRSSRMAFTGCTFCLLLLFCSLAAWSQQTEGAKKKRMSVRSKVTTAEVKAYPENI